MAIGMTYDQYWYGDPLMVRAFRKADKMRQERRDEEAWVQGMYFARALDAAVGNMFRKQGTTPSEYPNMPFLRETKPPEKPTEKQEEQEAVWAEAWMMSFVHAGKRWSKTQ